MLKTVMTSTCISVQGEFVRKFDDGRVMVRVGNSFHVGLPVQRVVRSIAVDDFALAGAEGAAAPMLT
jgi:hypothetical protein